MLDVLHCCQFIFHDQISFSSCIQNTRCGPYFGASVDAVQCLKYQTQWNFRTCNKETKHTPFWGVKTHSVLGCETTLCFGVWKHTLFWGVREKGFFYVVTKLQAKSQKTMKNLFVLQFCSWDRSFRHGEMKIWFCLYFQHVKRYIGTDFVEESRQKMHRAEEEHLFAKSALIGKSVFQIQRINAVHGRCSSSGVLRDIPSNLTLSVRRRIVLWFWALSGGIVAMSKSPEQMGWRTRTSALPIRDLCQIAYLLPMWGGIWSGGVFLWKRLICPQNSSWRMFWYGDLNSSHFFPRFGALEHEANRTPDISATFIGSRKKFCKRNRMSVCSARKRKASILSVSHRLNRFGRCNRWGTISLQILCHKMVRNWYNWSIILRALVSIWWLMNKWKIYHV